MTPAEALRAHATTLEQQATELRALAETLDGDEPHVEIAAPVTIGAKVAAKIMRVSETTAYGYGRRFGLGWQTQSGSWIFGREKVHAFASTRRDGNGGPLPDLEAHDLFQNAPDARSIE